MKKNDNNRIRTLSIFRSTIRVRPPLDTVSVVAEEHDGDSGDLPDPPLEIFITGGHDVGFVLSNSVDQTVVSVGSLNGE